MPPKGGSSADEKKLFKDWFDKQAAKALAAQIRLAESSFPTQKFIRIAAKDLQSLEFAGRVNQFAAALAVCLPDNIPKSLAIIRASFPPPLPDCDAVTDGWLQWPIGQYIGEQGLEYFDDSMSTMIELTQRFSAEFAVRPFVERRQQETIEYLCRLTDHESPHVRRWCSEGLRTRLPWGKKLHQLIADPKPVLPILEALKDDEEIYVRRSVANNLNDISKDHPDLVIARCRKWYKKSKPERVTLVKQALRGLIKDGRAEALAVIGFSKPEKLNVELELSEKKISLGGTLTLTATVSSTSASTQELLMDYAVHYVRKNGSSNIKVFKWKTLTIKPNETLVMTKKHSFKPTTVRALYPGKHIVELQINGSRVASAELTLTG